MKTNPAFFTSAAGIFISQVKEALLSIGVPVLLGSSLLLLTANKVQADNNTWESQGSSTDWNTASNWSLDTVPDTTGQIATFSGSGSSTVTLSANASPDSIDFTSPNSGYLIETSTYNLTLSGAGIEGTSSDDTFIVSTSGITGEGILAFANSASAGSGTQIINTSFGGVTLESSTYGGVTDFLGTSTADTANITNEGSGAVTNFESFSSAGSASIVNEAATASGQMGGGTAFGNSSTASNATVLNEGSTVADLFGGITLLEGSAVASNGTFINQNGASSDYSAGQTILTGNASAGTAVFQNLGGGTSLDGGKDVGPLYGGFMLVEGSATAASGTFNTFGGSVSGATGGDVFFTDTSSAGSATFNTYGGSASGAGGGEIGFESNSSAGSSTLIANGGTNGGAGAEIFFDANSTGGTVQVDVMGNGELDISNHASGTVAIGSLEGTGNVSLGANTLSVGQSTVTSVFSGVISDGGQGGSLAKVGTGLLSLSGASTYTGATTVYLGTLQVNGSITSDVTVDSRATLAGSGSVGNITLQSGGLLAPSSYAASNGVTLSAKSLLWKGGGTLQFDLGGTASDFLSLSGALTTDSSDTGPFTFDLTNQGSDGGQTFKLIGFTSENIPLADFVSQTGDGVTGVFSYNNDELQFTVAAEPEPSVWALLLGGMALMGIRLHRLDSGLAIRAIKTAEFFGKPSICHGSPKSKNAKTKSPT